MVCRLSHLLWAYFVLLCAIASPVSGISISFSSEGGDGGANSVESLILDHSTYFSEDITLDQGSISQKYQAVGSGKNSMQHSVAGNSFTIHSDIDSQGTLSASGYSFATGQSGSKIQSVSGTGIMNLKLLGAKEGTDAVQEANMVDGAMASSQNFSVGVGQGALAWQSTSIAGEAGRVFSQASSSAGLMLAEGTFSGRSSLDADLSAGAKDDSKVGGNIVVNGATWLDDAALQTISEENLGMSLQGLQATSDERIGSFSVRAVNMDAFALAQAAQSSDEATSLSSLSGGSSTSYILAKNSAGYPYRWNEEAPKVQLYLKSDTVPSNLDPVEVKYAISAAANTWDNAVAKNLFADGQTVINDPSKGIDQRDGFNVNAWKYLSDAPNALAYSRTWSGGPIVGGYYSALESDISYNTRWTWSTSGGDYDVQSVAVHELGHTIGLGDIYSTTYGGSLPPTDPRTQDFEQVMNAYDAPQRTLGNGDRAGAQLLYGVNADGIGVYRSGTWYLNGNRDGQTYYSTYFGGIYGDKPETGDWDADNNFGIGVYRSGSWYLNDNGDGKTYYSTYFGGVPGDSPVTGNWNADEDFGIGVYRSGTWYLNDNRDGRTYYSTYFGGVPGDIAVTGDWDGDGIFGIGVYRSGTWYLNDNRDGRTYYSTYFGGVPGDIPVTGDWDGDGIFGIGVYRSGTWYLNDNRDGKTYYSTYFGGLPGDVPVTGNW